MPQPAQLPRGIGKRLATASQDKTVRVWDVASSRSTHGLTDFPGWATHVAFSPDGNDLAVSGRFRDVFVIDLPHNRKRLVTEGQQVKAGQQIAEMGSSGSSRDELQFQIRKDGNPVDPLEYLPSR